MTRAGPKPRGLILSKILPGPWAWENPAHGAVLAHCLLYAVGAEATPPDGLHALWGALTRPGSRAPTVPEYWERPEYHVLAAAQCRLDLAHGHPCSPVGLACLGETSYTTITRLVADGTLGPALGEISAETALPWLRSRGVKI